jgi:hypothetical protein
MQYPHAATEQAPQLRAQSSIVSARHALTDRTVVHAAAWRRALRLPPRARTGLALVGGVICAPAVVFARPSTVVRSRRPGVRSGGLRMP